MIYVAIDLETTGIYPGKNEIIEIGAVIEDMVTPVEQLPVYHKYVVKEYGNYLCNPTAIVMNIEIIKKLNEYDWRIPIDDPQQKHPFIKSENLVDDFLRWLLQYGIVKSVEAPGAFTAGGKNFATFDADFLKALPHGKNIRFRKRVVDPAQLYLIPEVDNELPDLQTCLDRAGINKTVLHTAVEDSIDVIKLVRHHHGIPFEGTLDTAV